MISTGERGEFFNPAVSPFGYNETVAYEHFSMEKTQAIWLGFNRSDYIAPFPQADKIIQAKDLPKDIKEAFDDILTQTIECEITHKPFKILKPELEFYRKNAIPLPRRHPDQRHMDRMKRRNPRKLFDRKCNKCGTDIMTCYAPERPEIVYCENCYNKEIY
jgi:hypothetical protein